MKKVLIIFILIFSFLSSQSQQSVMWSQYFTNDVIYNPEQTNFLKKAKMLGNQTENGKMMFIYQAHQAFTIWHKIMPEIDDETIKLLD